MQLYTIKGEAALSAPVSGNTMRYRLIRAFLAGLVTASAASAAEPMRYPPIKAIEMPDMPAGIPLLSPAPGSNTEQWEQMGSVRIVRNVNVPALIPYLPAPDKATGAAVIIAPGGDYLMLAIDYEGTTAAQWLADRGVAAFVLKHRLEPTNRDSKAFTELLTIRAEGTRPAHLDPAPAALTDAFAAIDLVRRNAASYHVDPHRVGFLGFSAGAIVALSVGLAPEPSKRPDFIAPIYGQMEAVSVPSNAPPMFNALAVDDPFYGHNGYALIDSWIRAKRPVEFHLYERGRHFGTGRRNSTSDAWFEQFFGWMKARGLLDKVSRN